MCLTSHLMLWIFLGLLVLFTNPTFAQNPPNHGLKPPILSDGYLPRIMFRRPTIHRFPPLKNRWLLAHKPLPSELSPSHKPPVRVDYFVEIADATTPRLPPIITRIPPSAPTPTLRLPPIRGRPPIVPSPPTH
ncbi:hypothetical protein BVRB_3g049210 [Beta vulgaris subsp. vulgaris]|nr:hypothetical protein BVRB_3g049210 [Beta vulgaris subsp. vulgaris]